MGLAIWRLSSLLMKERGPFDLFVRVRKLIGVKHYDDGTPLSYKDNFFGNLFSCCWCLSVWIAFAYTAFYIFLPRYAIIFVIINNELLLFIQHLGNVFVLITGLYLGIGCYIIGYFIWQKSQKELKSSKGASFLYIEPFLTLIFSTLLNRPETILIWNLVGGFIVLAAVLIINYN